jgi:hypothetical protein
MEFMVARQLQIAPWSRRKNSESAGSDQAGGG